MNLNYQHLLLLLVSAINFNLARLGVISILFCFCLEDGAQCQPCLRPSTIRFCYPGDSLSEMYCCQGGPTMPCFSILASDWVMLWNFKKVLMLVSCPQRFSLESGLWLSHTADIPCRILNMQLD